MSGRIRRGLNAGGALVVALVVLALLGAGHGVLPPLGPALAPGGGLWAAAKAPLTASDETLRLTGLTRPVTVAFDRAGYVRISATTDDDLFLAQGYVAARFRLTEMDLERRAGSGQLAELDGAAKLDSDRFELRLGLLRTARATWSATPRGSAAGRALVAYARGVNDRLAELRASGQWPEIYGMTGVRPRPWTPVDSLVVQEVFTQQLDFSTVPLDYAVLRDRLGAERVGAWFPVRAATETADQPYDAGPYRALPPEPFDVGNANAAAPGADMTPAVARESALVPPDAAQAAGALLRSTHALSVQQQHLHPNSNAWAVNGPLAQDGRAMLAGDPHLQLSLPSYWFEVSLRSPRYDVSGASLPGLPAVVIGHNRHVAWSITNAQSQGTMYYVERTSATRPGEYFWRGAWRRVDHARYTIAVRGAKSVDLSVDLTVHGPIMTVNDRTVAVTWMGDYPSPDLAALLDVDTAGSSRHLLAAVEGWRAPALTFVYADDVGHIGAAAAGYVPQPARGATPWLPMPGTGAADLAGTIPSSALPQTRDPATHVVASTNQRPVSRDYPYYLGTSLDFDPGYRQSVLLRRLRAGPSTDADFGRIQTDVTDDLARRLVPSVLASLRGDRLGAREQAASRLLSSWDDRMEAGSAAASVWWTFLSKYVSLVFGPWWAATHTPTATDPWVFDLSTLPIPLREDLERWTLHDPRNPAFSLPDGQRRDATTVMRAAFHAAITQLTRDLGTDPDRWTWGRMHRREMPSLTGASALGYPAYPDGGDPWTVDAADGGLTSSFGPSWRMTVSWTGAGVAEARAQYPGGQSENPASPWYANLVPQWRSGTSRPVDVADPAATWSLRPAKRGRP